MDVNGINQFYYQTWEKNRQSANIKQIGQNYIDVGRHHRNLWRSLFKWESIPVLDVKRLPEPRSGEEFSADGLRDVTGPLLESSI